MKHLLLALGLLAAWPATLAAQTSGLAEFTLPAPHHDGTDMQVAVMFPASGGEAELFAGNAVFHGTPVLRDATPAEGRFPVILMSHGWGGTYERMAWLGAGLAERGAIVVAVNHPGSTMRDAEVEAAFNHWTRAQDLSLALDHVLGDSAFAAHADTARVFATGFSYGGWTALSLAGVTGRRAGFFDYCAAAGTGSRFCTELAARGVDVTAIDQVAYEASYRDSRVTRVAAIDPGLTWGLTQEDGAELAAPLLLVGLGDGEDRLHATDTSAGGTGFEGLVPQARSVVIAPATHFSALGLCKPIGEEILRQEEDDPVCTDPEGSSRAAVLDQVTQALAEHFGLN